MRCTSLPYPKARPTKHDEEVGAEEEAAGEGGKDVAHCYFHQSGVLGVDGDVDLEREGGRELEREEGRQVDGL